MAKFKTAAILACAGSGSRMRGTCDNKLLIRDGDVPVVAYALKAPTSRYGLSFYGEYTHHRLWQHSFLR